VEGALVDRRLAQVHLHDAVFLAVLDLPRHAQRQRHLPAHDAVAAQVVVLALNMCMEPPFPLLQPSARPYSSAITAPG
jgi:hypothetical protein